jgi:hypothetical protein
VSDHGTPSGLKARANNSGVVSIRPLAPAMASCSCTGNAGAMTGLLAFSCRARFSNAARTKQHALTFCSSVSGAPALAASSSSSSAWICSSKKKVGYHNAQLKNDTAHL